MHFHWTVFIGGLPLILALYPNHPFVRANNLALFMGILAAKCSGKSI